MEYERESCIKFSLIDRYHFKVDVLMLTNDFDIIINEIINSVNTMIRINETTWTSELKQRIDPTITSKLLPFQWEGIRHSIQQEGYPTRSAIYAEVTTWPNAYRLSIKAARW